MGDLVARQAWAKSVATSIMAHEIMLSFFNVIALISIRPSIHPSALLDINAFITIKI
jgi:hypothetical protein